MKSKGVLLAMVLAVLAGSAGRARSAPEPTAIPSAWELSFLFENPRAIRLTLPGESKPRVFWYMRYSVVNQTGQDVLFVPEFILYTDTGQLLRSGRGVAPNVFTQIKTTVNEPLLQDLTQVAGKLLQGEDNAKYGVAIWPDFDPEAGSFNVFVGGLSGETAKVDLPRPMEVVETTPEGEKVTVKRSSILLAKTLDLNFRIPGEAAARTRTPATLIAKNWVMR